MSKELISKAEFARRCSVSGGAVTKFVQGRGRAAVHGPRIDFQHPAAQDYYRSKTEPDYDAPAQGIDPLFEDALAWCRLADRWSPSAIKRTFKTGYARAQRIHAQLQAAGHVPEQEETKGKPASGQAPRPVATQNAAPKAAPRKHGKGRKSSWEDDSELVEVPDDIEGLAELSLRELIDRFGTGYRFYDWLRALKEIEAVNEKRIKNAQSMGRLVSRQLVEVGVIGPFNSAHVRLLTDGAKAITAAVLAKHKAGISEPEIEAYVADVVGSFIRPVKAKVERNLAGVTAEAAA